MLVRLRSLASRSCERGAVARSGARRNTAERYTMDGWMTMMMTTTIMMMTMMTMVMTMMTMMVQAPFLVPSYVL